MSAIFALRPDESKRLVVKLKPLGKGSITLDDRPLVEPLPTKTMMAKLHAGMSIPYGEGSFITIQSLPGNFLKPGGMVAKLDGVTLPGSPGTPLHAKQTAKGAGVFLYWIAGFNFVAGLVLQLTGSNPLGFLGGCVIAAIIGSLGYFVHRKVSLIALGIAIVLLAMDGLGTVIRQADAGGGPNPGGLVVRVFFVIMLINAFRIIRSHSASLRNN
jgi:hypothetical protein